jgi:Uma2 family endonuclease
MVISAKGHTEKDLWEISHHPDNEGKRFVLIEGVIVEMSPTGWKHGKVTMELGRLIANYVVEHQLGEVTAAETGFSLSGDGLNVLAPDIGFIAKARVPDDLPKGYVPLSPDFAVEVVSPGNSAGEIRMKIETYLRFGTKLVWIVYPEKTRVDVYRPTTDKAAIVEFVDLSGSLDGGEILPGFMLAVKDIFPASTSAKGNSIAK